MDEDLTESIRIRVKGKARGGDIIGEPATDHLIRKIKVDEAERSRFTVTKYVSYGVLQTLLYLLEGQHSRAPAKRFPECIDDGLSATWSSGRYLCL